MMVTMNQITKKLNLNQIRMMRVQNTVKNVAKNIARSRT